jgi:preprotein translocase SecE subunit
MAVAVKNSPGSQTRTAQVSLVVASAVGALFILASAAVVFWGVPRVWEVGWTWFLGLFGDPAALAGRLSFVGAAGLIVVEVVAIGLLTLLGTALVGPTPQRGLRAGVFTVLVGLIAAGFVTVLLGRLFETWFAGMPGVGIALTAAVGFGLLFWGWTLLTKPKAPERLRSFEDQGWFSSDRLKPMQGQRVRRATMLGVILLVAAGLYSLYSHTLNTVAPNWMIRVPFTQESYIWVLPDVKFTLPLLIGAAGLWLAFRVVNVPVFADFLIATEAELNKVSWPSRRSVVQDTIVVLTTVLLLTLFLFLVDIGWGWLLSRNVVGVIRSSDAPKATQTTNLDKTPY